VKPPPRSVARSLQELASLRDDLARRAHEESERVARQATEHAAAERARREFADAVGPLNRLRASPRAEVRVDRPLPLPRQRHLDEQAALREAMSDEVDIESLLLTDDGLSFRRPGVTADVVSRLRRGQWALQGELDLHGLRREEARLALIDFIRLSARQGRRCLRVVHGKGNGSPGRQPVLKAKVQRWLAQCGEVVAFTQASGPEGGNGALLVLLSGDRPGG
jgi:DNA-nicking Smr family endonuclease